MRRGLSTIAAFVFLSLFQNVWANKSAPAVLAKDWFDRGRLAVSTQKRIEAFQKVIALDPLYWGAWCYLGYAYASDQNWAKADEAFDKELEIHPNDDCALQGKGAIRLEQQKWDDAIINFDQVIKFHKDSREAYLGRAVAKDAKGDIEGAEADRRHAEKGGQVSKRVLFASWGPLLLAGVLFILLGLRGLSRHPRILSGATFIWSLLLFVLIFVGPIWSDFPILKRKMEIEDLGAAGFILIVVLGLFFIVRRLKTMVWVYNASGGLVYRALCNSLRRLGVKFSESPFVIESSEGLIKVSDHGLWNALGSFRFENSSASFRRKVVDEFIKEIRNTKCEAYPTSAIFSVAVGLVLVLIALNEVVF